ncbi:MAG: hypothetical protein WCF90_01700 [Methanomicrobiales archaeon]
MVKVSVTVDKNLKIFVDNLLEKVCYTLLDKELRYWDTMTEIRFHTEHKDPCLVLVCEDDGVGVTLPDKE